MKPYVLSECKLEAVRAADYNLAILPWGATEPHNYHLPYGTDNYEVEKIAEESARLAWEGGAKVTVLPGISFGVNTGQRNIKLAINLYPSTQAKILHDIAESLNSHGINKLLIFNRHGGNDFRQIIRELGVEFPGMLICTCNWYQALDKSIYFENEGDHADEMETSLMQFIEPDLVLPLEKAGSGKYKKFRVQSLNESWAWTERKWTKLTEDTGVGNPHKATRSKGEKYFNDLTQKLSRFLIELSATGNEDMYV